MSRPSWLMDMGIWLIILWLIISKFDGWAAGAYTGMGGYWNEYGTVKWNSYTTKNL